MLALSHGFNNLFNSSIKKMICWRSQTARDKTKASQTITWKCVQNVMISNTFLWWWYNNCNMRILSPTTSFAIHLETTCCVKSAQIYLTTLLFIFMWHVSGNRFEHSRSSDVKLKCIIHVWKAIQQNSFQQISKISEAFRMSSWMQNCF